MKRLIISCLLVISAVFTLAAQADLTPLATVKITKPDSVTLKQLKARVETVQKQTGVKSLTVAQKKEVLDRIIDEKLLVQAAQKAGLSVTDARVNEYFLYTASAQFGKPLNEIELSTIVKGETGKTLDEYTKSEVGMSLVEYKEYLKNQLLAQDYIVTLKKSELELLDVSESEVRSFYEINKSSYVQPDILKMFLVIIPKGSDAAAAKTRATALYADVKNKKVTNDQLKIRMQTDKTLGAGDMYVSKTAQAAQTLGYDYNTLLRLFEKNIGFMSEINETPTDYQFYTILAKYDAKMLSLNDLVQPGADMTISDAIKSMLFQQKQAEFFAASVTGIVSSLRTASNFQMLKTGAALDKLLDW